MLETKTETGGCQPKSGHNWHNWHRAWAVSGKWGRRGRVGASSHGDFFFSRSSLEIPTTGFAHPTIHHHSPAIHQRMPLSFTSQSQKSESKPGSRSLSLLKLMTAVTLFSRVQPSMEAHIGCPPEHGPGGLCVIAPRQHCSSDGSIRLAMEPTLTPMSLANDTNAEMDHRTADRHAAHAEWDAL